VTAHFGRNMLQNKRHVTPWTKNYRHTRQDRWIQTELAFKLAKNVTKPNPVEIIRLQTTKKENNWKTEEILARSVVTLETERIKLVKSLKFMVMMMINIVRFDRWCLFIYYYYYYYYYYHHHHHHHHHHHYHNVTNQVKISENRQGASEFADSTIMRIRNDRSWMVEIKSPITATTEFLN